MSKILLCSTVATLLSAGVTSRAFALNQATHKIVNEEAASASTLDSLLQNQFGFPQGLTQRVQGRAIISWLGEGGIREDDSIRFLRHFHDPLQPWASAGLDFFGKFQSSIHWMQRPTACDDATWRRGKDWTWSAARCYFRRALTEPSAKDRDVAWAYTFRAVGQVMHLVVDASVPEHTRNDPHPLGGLFGSYEYRVESLHGRPGSTQEDQFIAKYLSNATRPSVRLLEEPTNDGAAPVRVARLIDAEVYTGVDPNVTLNSSIGIAEFSNANFFSEDSEYRRFLAPNYPYPSVERLVPSERELPAGGGVRAYYKKGLGDGLEVDPVLAQCAMDAAFRDDGIPAPQYKCADRNVWEQTALAMLPRAVGYAAALVDYFFRGRLEGKLLPPEPDGSYPRLRITNPIPTDGRAGERMLGTFEAYYDAADGTRVPVGRWDGQDLAAGTTRELTLADPPPGAPPPAEPGRYLLVFRGQLGDEAQAVAASWIDGRVWLLSLGVVAYERDWAETPPPTTHPAGPTYSRSLTVRDSTGFFDGTSYFVNTYDSYERGQIYPWTCQGPDYAPVLLGDPVRGDWHTYSLVYRGPAVAWDGSTTLRVTAYRTVGGSYEPVTIEVVRFVPPKSLEELQSYTYDNPPTVDAVLFETVTLSREPTDIGPIPLNGAAFVGVRARPIPAYPTQVPDTSRGGDLDYRCFRILLQYGELSFVWGLPMTAGSYAFVEWRTPIAP